MQRTLTANVMVSMGGKLEELWPLDASLGNPEELLSIRHRGRNWHAYALITTLQ